MDAVVVGAVWLHLLATVTLIGYYAILGLLVLPLLRRIADGRELAESLATLERRALPLLVGSVAVFIATGVYLMGSDTRYGGVGSIGSTWASVLLLKHLVVALMVGLGLYIDAVIVRAAAAEVADRAIAVRRLTLATGAMTVLGAVVLLLTAVAQAS